MNKKFYVIIGILLVLIIAVSTVWFIDFNKDESANTNGNIAVKNEEKEFIKEKNINLYFGSDDSLKLMPEARTIKVKKDEEIYIKSIEELIKGPQTPSFFPVISFDTKVNSVLVKEKNANVDFSETFIKLNTGNIVKEKLCIYSIVNTLCEFENIDRVFFYINGEKLEKFGNIDLSNGLIFNDEIIKKNK